MKLWSVFVPQSVRETQEYYPQLLEIPKEHLRRMRERGEIDDSEAEIEEEIVEERRRSYIDQSPRPVLEVCDDARIERLVILGDPGAGKSALLQFLALRWARIEDPTLLYTQPLPLLVELRKYVRWQCASGKSFVRFLHEGQTWHRLNQSDLDRKLREHGATVLLLDGLDEIFDPARREDALNDIQRFSNDYPEAKVIVTSRLFGYKQQRLSDAEFRYFMLQDLDDSQIAEFLDRSAASLILPEPALWLRVRAAQEEDWTVRLVDRWRFTQRPRQSFFLEVAVLRLFESGLVPSGGAGTRARLEARSRHLALAQRPRSQR